MSTNLESNLRLTGRAVFLLLATIASAQTVAPSTIPLTEIDTLRGAAIRATIDKLTAQMQPLMIQYQKLASDQQAQYQALRRLEDTIMAANSVTRQDWLINWDTGTLVKVQPTAREDRPVREMMGDRKSVV